MAFEVNRKKLNSYKKLSLGIVVFAMVFATCYGISMRHLERITPPAGYVFPVASALRGIYFCCSNAERNPRAHVDQQEINCATPRSAIGSSPRGADYSKSCGLQGELNGKIVLVEQRSVPVLCGYCWFSTGLRPIPLVTRITSNGKVYFERDGEQLRDVWIRDFRDVNLMDSVFVAGAIAAIFFVLVNSNGIT